MAKATYLTASQKTEIISEYFTPERRKVISIQGVEKMANIPLYTLSNFLNDISPLAAKHLDGILEVITLLQNE